MELTPQRAVVLRTLENGPVTWTTLRMTYYGPLRSKSKASTSFINQLNRMMTLRLIDKVSGGYESTTKGKELLSYGDPVKVLVSKTEAQLKAEAECSHPLVDAYERCLTCGGK